MQSDCNKKEGPMIHLFHTLGVKESVTEGALRGSGEPCSSWHIGSPKPGPACPVVSHLQP